MKPRRGRDGLQGASSIAELITSVRESYRKNVLDIKCVLAFSLTFVKNS
jgi:hypothetical protein